MYQEVWILEKGIGLRSGVAEIEPVHWWKIPTHCKMTSATIKLGF